LVLIQIAPYWVVIIRHMKEKEAWFILIIMDQRRNVISFQVHCLRLYSTSIKNVTSSCLRVGGRLTLDFCEMTTLKWTLSFNRGESNAVSPRPYRYPKIFLGLYLYTLATLFHFNKTRNQHHHQAPNDLLWNDEIYQACIGLCLADK